MMKSGHYTIEEWDTEPIRKIPSLVDLCVQKAVDNVRYLGDVGETDFHLLERFLPHCTVEQLTHIEDSTEERDLSPVTDKLWKNFYTLQFGVKSTNVVVERMKEKRVSFSWRQLYEAKLKDVEEAQQKSFERIKQLYKKEDASSLEVKPYVVYTCVWELEGWSWRFKETKRSKVDKFNYALRCHPPATKGVFGECNLSASVGSSSIGNTKSGIMKKAKLEFLNSPEVKNLSAMKKTNFQNTQRVSPIIKKQSPSASSSKFCTSTARRF